MNSDVIDEGGVVVVDSVIVKLEVEDNKVVVEDESVEFDVDVEEIEVNVVVVDDVVWQYTSVVSTNTIRIEFFFIIFSSC